VSKYLAILCLLLITACDRKITIVLPNEPTPVETPKPVLNRIEFRVLGNAVSAKVRYLNPVDGITQTITTLPYSIGFSTEQTTMFLSIEATPIQYPTGTILPFMSAQIFVNGLLFREASSADFTATTISASGTWRK
jgi:hypothetical protein